MWDKSKTSIVLVFKSLLKVFSILYYCYAKTSNKTDHAFESYTVVCLFKSQIKVITIHACKFKYIRVEKESKYNFNRILDI